VTTILVTEAWARGAGLALTLAISALRSPAQGIIHTVPAQPLYYGAVVNSQDIDLNGDGSPDFRLLSDGTEVDLVPLANNALVAVPELPPDLGSFVAALNQGTPVSSSLDPVLIWYGANTDPFGSALIVACVDLGCLGNFQNGTDAYAGVRLDAAGTLRYGWIHIQSFGLNFGQISEWAYETGPNSPILAGAVPEPSTFLILCFGVVLLIARHRSSFSRTPQTD